MVQQNQIWTYIGREVMRYILAIALLMVCIIVEWQAVDRLTIQAYQVRYTSALERFRGEPYIYNNRRTDKYLDTYEMEFQQIIANITEEIRCFPVEKSYIQEINYVDSWYGERTYGGERKHEGTDIMANSNIAGEIPIVSMTDGVVKNLGWLRLGGWRVGIESDSGVYYYYAHLDSYAPNLQIGNPVYAGQLLGFMGDSGYGEEGTTGMFPVHLHLGIYVYDSNGTEISLNPYPILTYFEESHGILSGNNEKCWKNGLFHGFFMGNPLEFSRKYAIL